MPRPKRPTLSARLEGAQRAAEFNQAIGNQAQLSGAEMAAECLWPVEARFLSACIADDARRLPTAPYPIHEIASVMLSAGMDPMGTYERTPSEMPRHNPLADARQSARLLVEALARIKSGNLGDLLTHDLAP